MIKKYLVLSLLFSQSMILRSMFTRMPNPGRLNDKDQVQFASIARNYESRKRAVAIFVVNTTPVGQDPQLDAVKTVIDSKKTKFYLKTNAQNAARVVQTKATNDLHSVLDCYRGKNLVDKVKDCIDKGANVNSKNRRDLSPLAALIAFRSQSDTEERNNINFGGNSDPDYPQKNAEERQNRVDIARALLQAGANPNNDGCQSGSSLLMGSCGLWLPEFAQTLLEHGADPNEVLGSSNTPLFLDVLYPSRIDLANAFIDTGELDQDVKNQAIEKLEEEEVWADHEHLRSNIRPLSKPLNLIY